MNKRTLLTITISILIATTVANCSPRPQAEAPEIVSAIRNATILIQMEMPNPENPANLLQSTGIGSLVEFQGQTYLVTHNHWRQMLTDTTIVRFYDADNHPIMNIIGKQFRQMIVHADPGALILLPLDVMFQNQTPVHMEADCSLVAGQTVDIVYRQTPDRTTATVEQAVVKEVLDYNGHPAYKLQSLDGSYIQQGDSGGGVWQNGVLVAVNWTTEQQVLSTNSNEASNDVMGYTGTSYAAIYTNEVP